MTDTETTWANRVVAHEDADPHTLTANPKNWRVHTERQAKALRAVLGGIGWVQSVLVNRTTGLILDGHLRVQEAVHTGAATVPVDWVELTPGEEAIALASLDPMRLLADMDRDLYDELREESAVRHAAMLGLVNYDREMAQADDDDQREQDGREGMTVDHTAAFDQDEELEDDGGAKEPNPYASMAIRQIQFIMERDVYERVLNTFDLIMDEQGLGTNAAVVLFLLERYSHD